MQPVISIQGLTKTYKSGLQALKATDLAIAKGEIFALLGPNGAGKTTLISIVCGIVTPSSGTVVRVPVTMIGASSGSSCASAGCTEPSAASAAPQTSFVM